MDWGAPLLWVGANLIITVFVYLLVPIIVILSKKKCEAKTIRKIAIINCVVVWIIFRIIELSIGDEASSGAAVFLWGAIGYFIMKKFCLKDTQATATSSSQSTMQPPQVHVSLSDKDEPPVQYGNYNVKGSDIGLIQEPEVPKANPTLQKSQPVQMFEQTVKSCSCCGNTIDPITRKCCVCGKQYFKSISAKTVCIILLSVLLAASLVGNIIQCVTNVTLRAKADDLGQDNASLKTEVAELKKDVADYKDDVADLKGSKEYYYEYWYNNNDKIDLMDSSVVFIEDDGTNLYHKYECNKFVGNDWWAHNVEYAEYLGYNPCSLCCD